MTEQELVRFCTGCGSCEGWNEEATEWCNVCWDLRKPIPRPVLDHIEELKAKATVTTVEQLDIVGELYNMVQEGKMLLMQWRTTSSLNKQEKSDLRERTGRHLQKSSSHLAQKYAASAMR